MTTPTHERLKQNALDAIQALHADTTVPAEQTLESLTDIAGTINELTAAIKDDLK